MSSRGPFFYTRLDLPSPLAIDTARAAVSALASMAGQPRLVLEARGESGRVSWYLGAEAATSRRALQAIAHHLHGLRSRTGSKPVAATAAGVVRVAGHRRAPLATGATEEVARSVLGALSCARKGELVRLQVILGPRHRPMVVRDVPAQDRVRVNAKLAEHRFSCELRIGAKASDTARAGSLIQGVAASLRPLESPGIALRLKKASLRSLDDARDPFMWPLELGVSELTALLGWPLAGRDAAPLPGVASPHPRLLPVATSLPKNGRVLGISAIDNDRPVAIDVETSLRHLHILGPSGVGKSVLLINLAMQDIAAGRACVVIDPKGDAISDLLARIDPSRHQDVVVLDPTDPEPVGVDVFAGDPERAADAIQGVFKSLYGGDIGPRSSDVLHAGILTLARAGNCSLSMLPMLLTNVGFRRTVTARVTDADPMGLGAFWGWFEHLSDAERLQVVAPLRNKLDPVLTLRPGLRAVFGQRQPKFALSDLFAQDKRPILLVSLSSGVMGPEGARLLGSVLVSLLWQAAQERVHVPAKDRHPVMVHIDEMQEYVRIGDLGDALARARGLSVGFTLAHQAMTQLPTAVREAVMANARSRIAFQLSAQDAKEVASTTNGVLMARDFQELPAYGVYASLLARGDRAPWCSLTTRPLPGPSNGEATIRALSRARFGRPIKEVEAELLAVGGFGKPQERESFGRTRRKPGGAE